MLLLEIHKMTCVSSQPMILLTCIPSYIKCMSNVSYVTSYDVYVSSCDSTLSWCFPQDTNTGLKQLVVVFNFADITTVPQTDSWIVGNHLLPTDKIEIPNYLKTTSIVENSQRLTEKVIFHGLHRISIFV